MGSGHAPETPNEAPRRHLALVCILHQAWRDTLDQAVDMYGKLLDRNRKLVEARLDDMLKAQRQAVDRIVHRYRQLGAVLLDPDVGGDKLRVRLLSTVPEAQQTGILTAGRGRAPTRGPGIPSVSISCPPFAANRIHPLPLGQTPSKEQAGFWPPAPWGTASVTPVSSASS